MSNEDLAKYVTKLGDRCAIRRFCAKDNSQSMKGKAKKSSLLEKLKKKLNKRSGTQQDDSVSTESEEECQDKRRKTLKGNSNAMKDGRTIKMGWKHFERLEYIQVRSDKGGGTDDIFVPKSFTKLDLIAKAKSMFFQDGLSSKGHEDDLEFDMADFRSQPLDDTTTIGELFEKTNRRNLRYYLFTKAKSKVSAKKFERNAQQTHNVKLNDTEDGTFNVPDPDIPGPSGLTSTLGSCMPSHIPLDSDSDTLPDLSDYLGCVRTLKVELPDGTQEDVIYNIEPDDSGVIQLNFENQEILRDEILIRVHRGHALNELVEAFSNTLISENTKVKFQMVLPNGNIEAAQDEGGVTRDCLTEFWESFYATCTLGRDSKVPYLRHDYGHLQWEAVGKIIKFGYKEFGYFPVEIAKPFIEYCVLGEAKTDLKQTFFSYISPSEASLLQQALTEYRDEDLDELNDILQSYDCRRLLKPENIETIVQEIAHKEIVQKPMFVIDSFKVHLSGLMTETKLLECYTKLIPTNRSLLTKICFPENISEKETEMKKYLQRFIRELDKEALGKFLRFCTGSNLLLKEIAVRFTQIDGFARRFIAHTCGCILEIPDSYENYVEFRSEFTSVLKSDVWVMDID